MTGAGAAPSARRLSRGEAAWLVATLLSLAFGAEQIRHLNALYVAPHGRPAATVVAIALPVLAVAFSVRWSPAHRAAALLPALSLAALSELVAGLLPPLVFDGGVAAPWVSAGSIAFGFLALGVALVALLAAFDDSMSSAVQALLSPTAVLAVAGGSLAALSIAASIGTARAVVCGASFISVVAVTMPRRIRHSTGVTARFRWVWLLLPSLTSLVAASGVARFLPLDEIARHPDEVVFVSDRGDHRHVVTAAPGGYELFTDGQIRIATLDETRRAYTLVRPALRAATTATRVLLLHGGGGVVERAILGDPRVQSLTIIADGDLLRLGRGLPWLATLSHGALDDERVHPVDAECAPWLLANGSRFDVVIDDAPSPLGYGEGKYYTLAYFDLLAAHVADGGAFVMPATSALTSRDAFTTVLATARSTGGNVAAYHAAIPTRGVSSFVVGTRTPGNPMEGVANDALAFDTGRDLTASLDGATSTSFDQRVVDAFARRHPVLGGEATR